MFNLAEGLPEELGLDEIVNQTFLEKIIANFNWNNISQTIIVASIRIIFSLIVFLIVHFIAKWAINLFFKRFLESKTTDHNRYETIYNVVMNVYRTIFIFFLVYTLLDILSFPVGTLLASAGIVGLTVSFGAQGFVSDLVNGFTILSGKQLSIGDHVIIEEVEGNVLNLNLRTTEVKDFDGTVHFIPNREILIISNKSKSDMRALVQVRLFPETDTDIVRKLVDEINETHVSEFPEITVYPDVLFVSNSKNQLMLRVSMYVKAGSQFGIENKFYEMYVNKIVDAGIDLPYGDIDFEK